MREPGHVQGLGASPTLASVRGLGVLRTGRKADARGGGGEEQSYVPREACVPEGWGKSCFGHEHVYSMSVTTFQ